MSYLGFLNSEDGRAQKFSLYVLYTELYHHNVNAHCTNSEVSSFHPLFFPCHFIFGSPFDYISMFISVEIFIMLKYLYLRCVCYLRHCDP